jgi:hypothetical protein
VAEPDEPGEDVQLDPLHPEAFSLPPIAMTSIARTIGLACAVALGAASASALQLDQTELLSLEPPAPTPNEQAGEGLAASGEWLLVGAPQTPTSGTGSVRVYRDTGAGPVLQQQVPPPSGTVRLFGRRIATDGDSAVVGAYTTAFALVRTGTTWSVQQALPPSSGTPETYATAVAIDGDTAAVGHYGMADARVWIWRRTGSVWNVEQLLQSPAGGNDGFGLSLALSGDTLIIGARDDDQGATDAGAFFVYVRSGSQWNQQVKVLGSPIFASRRLGAAVAVQPLGGGQLEVVAGAAGPGSGRALLFEGAGASWTQTVQLSPLTGGSDTWFGSAVGLAGDWLAIGAWRADAGATDTGQGTLYRRCGAIWVRQSDLVPSNVAKDDRAGFSVAVSGGLAVLGAPGHDGAATASGAAYVFGVEDTPVALYCHGDGAGTPCPCGNDAPAGVQGGCSNSTGSGALAVTNDSTQLSVDKFAVHACGLLPDQPALLFAGEQALGGGNGLVFGDGLRCSGVNVVRLGTETPDANGDASWGPGLHALGGWGPGDQRFLQVWYRDPIGGPCASGFNLTNGADVTFTP